MNIISKIRTASVILSALLIISCSDDDSDIEDTTGIGNTELTDSQSNLEITLRDHDERNYENNEVFESGDVDFEFVITNVGEKTIEAGTNVYVSILFDEAQFNLDLIAQGVDAATKLVLEEDLASGESFVHITSPVDFLNVEATLDFIGVRYVDVCSIVWGTTEASIGNFESDLNSEDNTFCIGFGIDDDVIPDPQSDLEITLSNYENDQVFETGDVDFEFVIKNVGETTLEAGSNIYASIMFNEAQFDLDLVTIGDAAATTLVLDEDLAPGEFFTHVTSPVDFLNVEATLQFIGGTSADVCSIVWGTTEESVGTFESDLNSKDNTFCIGFGSDDDIVEQNLQLTIRDHNEMNYENNEVFPSGDVDFEFVIKNVGETTLEAGSSVYLSMTFGDVQFDLDLVGQGEDAATELVLDEDLAPGESFIHRTAPVDFLNVEATLGFLPFLGIEGTFLDVCSIVWGTTEASVGTFELDSNSEDNTFCLGFGTM